MKPKHKELKDNRVVQKPLDFANLYKSATETNVNLIEKNTVVENKKKKRKAIDSPNIVTKDSNNVELDKNNDNSFKNKTGLKNIYSLTGGNNRINKMLTDFPLPSDMNFKAEDKTNELKSLSSNKKRSKNKHANIPMAIDNNTTDHSTNLQKIERKLKPKKRNKSISFMLEDNEIAIKKTKCNVISTSETLIKPKNSKRKTTHNECKIGNNAHDAENKENNSKAGKETIVNLENDKTITKKSRKKSKKHKGNKTTDLSADNEEVENKLLQKVESKQSKKIKYHTQMNEDSNKTNSEPVTKSRKKDDKPEVIADDLENLKIGDNTHTLTSLLDEMSVVNQKKKNRYKSKKNKYKQPNTENTDTEVETTPEKQKWNKKKRNKDKEGKCDHKGSIPIIVENLPINIIFNYKKLLTEHFTKFGLVKNVGIAQVYPTEDPKPVFSTTVYFIDEDTAKEALQEDNTYFEGNVIRVKESLPPTQTIAVVHTYGEMNDQIISSIFSEAGRIRRIRQRVKTNKSKAIAFVEFDGPEAVERAIKIAEESKIGGKNVHVSKYRSKPEENKKKNAIEPENQTESDGSNN